MQTQSIFAHNYDTPFLSSNDNVIIALKELTHALQNPAPAAPFSTMGDNTLSAINKLAEVLTTSIEKFPPKLLVPKLLQPTPTLEPVQTLLPPVTLAKTPTTPSPNSVHIIEDDFGNIPSLSSPKPFPKSKFHVVPSDPPSPPRVLIPNTP